MKHEIETYDSEPPSNLDAFVGMVSKTAEEQHLAVLHAFSVRVPVTIAAMFEAMAEYSGKSRNRLIIKALEVALDQLYEQISVDDRAAIDKLFQKRLGEMTFDKNAESGEV